jgi:FtsZ-binding cell division protein ZapB
VAILNSAEQQVPGDPELERVKKENARLRAETDRLRVHNADLRRQNRQLHTELDAHVARAQQTGLFGPLELSAGTCVGPRRQRAS